MVFKQKGVICPLQFAPMKNNTSFTSFLLPGLAALSLFCYIHLHYVAYQTTGHCPSSLAVETLSAEEEQSPDILLPDIALVKRIVNITKIVLPKD